MMRKKGGFMSNAQNLMDSMEQRYGTAFVRDIKKSCNLTDDDYQNVILIFKAAIYTLDKFCSVKQSTLNALRVYNPKLEGVRISDDSEVLIGDSYFSRIKAEIDAMRLIVKTL